MPLLPIFAIMRGMIKDDQNIFNIIRCCNSVVISSATAGVYSSYDNRAVSVECA